MNNQLCLGGGGGGHSWPRATDSMDQAVISLSPFCSILGDFRLIII